MFTHSRSLARPARRAGSSLALVISFVICLAQGAGSLLAQSPAKRLLAADDVYRVQEVAGPQVSPDGKWIAYTVSSVDREADRFRTAVWMVDWEGAQNRRVTYGPESETTPRWSPDGRYLAFLSARPAEGKTQVWLLDRRGGEATQLTDVKDDIDGYEWSPDGKLLALVMQHAGEDA